MQRDASGAKHEAADIIKYAVRLDAQNVTQKLCL